MSKRAKKLLVVILLLAAAGGAAYIWFHWGNPVQLWAAETRRTPAPQQNAQVRPASGAAGEEPAPTEEPPGVAILLTVVHGDGSRQDFSIATKERNLRRILEKEGLIAGVEYDWGLYVLAVDGETADTSLQQWWCLSRDGEVSTVGVDGTVIAGGEHFTYTLITGSGAEDAVSKPASVTFTLRVIHGDESEKVFTITTTETTLRAALEQQGLIEGVEGDYGLYIYTVDGETIHESHHDWWRLTKNGELSELGVDHIQIADGDRYELSFVKGVY